MKISHNFQDKFLEQAFFRILDKTLNIEDLSVKSIWADAIMPKQKKNKHNLSWNTWPSIFFLMSKMKMKMKQYQNPRVVGNTFFFYQWKRANSEKRINKVESGPYF